MVRGRPREFDRDEALQAAMLVFWRKGFVATSMSELCDTMGIASPSLYAAFGSKEGLYVEAVDHYTKSVLDPLFRCLESGGPARSSMRDFLSSAAKGLRKSAKNPAGCMVTLAVLDEDTPAPVKGTLRKARREFVERVRVSLKAAVDARELPASTDVDILSRFYAGMVQCMAIQAHDGATSKELEGLAETAMSAWPAE